MLLVLLACTCAGSATPPDDDPPPAEVAAPALPEAHRPLCRQPLACGLLVHHPLDVVEASVCGWCGEDAPGLCGTWLPAAPGETEPRCAIYRELERCVMQQAGVTRFGDLPDVAQANVLALQDREDQRTDCVE